MINRFEIAKQYKALNALTFLRYLMSLDAIRARDEFMRFLKYLIGRIKAFSSYGVISHIKGLNPFGKGKGVDPDYYDYSKTDDYKVQIETFLDSALGIHELYMKPEYQDIFKELQDYYKNKGIYIDGAELTKEGFFKIPGIEHLVTVVPANIYNELAEFAKADPYLKTLKLKEAVIGETASGKQILNYEHEAVKKFVLSKTLSEKEITEEIKDKAKTDKKEPTAENKNNKKEAKGIPVSNKPRLKSMNGKWEKCDVSKDADLKKKLMDYPPENWQDVSVRFTIHPSLIMGQDSEHYFVRCPGIMNVDNKWVNVSSIAGKNIIVRLPKKDTRQFKSNIISCMVNIGEKYPVCDEKGAIKQENGQNVEAYGLMIADKFEIKDINVKSPKHWEKIQGIHIDGEEMTECRTKGGFVCAYSDKRAVILSYEGGEKNVKIPSSIRIQDKEIPVDEIKDGAFAGQEITTVEVPEGIREIRNGAFRDCKELTHISLPKSLIALGDGVFNGCLLQEIEMQGNDHVRYDNGFLISDGILIKSAQKDIKDGMKIPDDVTIIGEYAMAGLSEGSKAGGKTIDLNNVTEICRGGFEKSSWEHIKGAEKLETVHSLGFYNADVSEINLWNLKEIGEMAFSKSGITCIQLESIQRMGMKAFEDTYALNKAIINAKNLDRETYDPSAFSGCSKLRKIEWQGLTPEEQKHLEEKRTEGKTEEADTKEKAVIDYADRIAELESYKMGLYQMLGEDISPDERGEITGQIDSVEEAIATYQSVINQFSSKDTGAIGLDTRKEAPVKEDPYKVKPDFSVHSKNTRNRNSLEI